MTRKAPLYRRLLRTIRRPRRKIVWPIIAVGASPNLVTWASPCWFWELRSDKSKRRAMDHAHGEALFGYTRGTSGGIPVYPLQLCYRYSSHRDSCPALQHDKLRHEAEARDDA